MVVWEYRQICLSVCRLSVTCTYVMRVCRRLLIARTCRWSAGACIWLNASLDGLVASVDGPREKALWHGKVHGHCLPPIRQGTRATAPPDCSAVSAHDGACPAVSEGGSDRAPFHVKVPFPSDHPRRPRDHPRRHSVMLGPAEPACNLIRYQPENTENLKP
jgi:hypothetical protein